MVFTVFDTIMARSLRSLAGFCMGEHRDFEMEKNILITTYVIILKFHYYKNF